MDGNRLPRKAKLSTHVISVQGDSDTKMASVDKVLEDLLDDLTSRDENDHTLKQDVNKFDTSKGAAYTIIGFDSSYGAAYNRGKCIHLYIEGPNRGKFCNQPIPKWCDYCFAHKHYH